MKRTRPLDLLAALALCGGAALTAGAAPQETSPIDGPGERVHVAREGVLQASSLWRSERGLDRSARQLLEVMVGVNAAGAPAPEGPGAGTLEVLLAESPFQLGKLAGRRGERLQLVPDFRGGGLAAVAVAPKLNDRVLFGTGLPPRTRRLAALAAASALTPEGAGSGEPAWLWEGVVQLRAQRGLERAGHARALAVEPWSATGLLDLQQALAEVEPDGRGERLLTLAAEPVEREVYRPSLAWRAGASDAARTLMALAREDGVEGGPGALAAAAAGRLAEMRPRWRVVSGDAAGHPLGWMATASQAGDALVLSAEPLEDAPFGLTASTVIFANDPKFAGQADIVLGDQDGDRLLLAINTREGIYLFRRSGAGAAYETLAEVRAVEVPAFREIEVKLEYDGEVLSVEVGGVKMPPVRLGDRSLSGAVGFGCHAGSTAFFKRFELR